jgi:hypothetical protein
VCGRRGGSAYTVALESPQRMAVVTLPRGELVVGEEIGRGADAVVHAATMFGARVCAKVRPTPLAAETAVSSCAACPSGLSVCGVAWRRPPLALHRVVSRACE